MKSCQFINTSIGVFVIFLCFFQRLKSITTLKMNLSLFCQGGGSQRVPVQTHSHSGPTGPSWIQTPPPAGAPLLGVRPGSSSPSGRTSASRSVRSRWGPCRAASRRASATAARRSRCSGELEPSLILLQEDIIITSKGAERFLTQTHAARPDDWSIDCTIKVFIFQNCIHLEGYVARRSLWVKEHPTGSVWTVAPC